MSGLPSGGGGHGAWPHHPAQPPAATTTTTSTAITVPNNKRKRRPAGTPDPDAEVVALSPKTLMESDRYICEICNQGFQRDQNLQMHRRRHKVPWKLLKKPSSLGTNKRVYICPERSCLHHDPSHALGDLVGIKKHYRRKHCTEKQWKCVKCSKRYAVQSDYKAHLKTCGTRGHCCDCGRVFSRVESFIEHQDTCGAVKHKSPLQSGVGASPPVQHTDRISISHDTRTSQSSDSTTQGMSFGLSGASDTAATNSVPDSRRIPEVRSTAAAAFNAAMPAWLMEAPKLEPQSPNIYRPASIDASSTPFLQLSIGRAGSVTEEATSPCLRLSIGPSGGESTAAVADTKPGSWTTTPPGVCSAYPTASSTLIYGAGNGIREPVRSQAVMMEPAADQAASLRDFLALSWRPSAAMQQPGCVSR